MSYRAMREMLRNIPKYLRAINNLKAIRRSIYEEIEAVERDINPQSQVLSGMPHGTGISMTTENEAFKLMSLKERYRTRLDDLNQKIMEMQGFIDRIELAMCFVSVDQERIIRMRYWQGKSMTETALALNRSEPMCYVLERKAFLIMGEHL